jgi:hypothetical protein
LQTLFMIAKPLPTTSTTTPMKINKGAFMCGLRYLRAPRAYPHYLGANERPMNAPREG